MLRRCDAGRNIRRSVLRVLLGLGKLTIEIRNGSRIVLALGGSNVNPIATTSVARSNSIRVIGPRRIVYRLASRGTSVDVHVGIRHNHNCIPTSAQVRSRRSRHPVNHLLISTYCDPIRHVTCGIRTTHMRRHASLSGLIVRVRAGNAVSPRRTVHHTTAVLTRRLRTFISLHSMHRPRIGRRGPRFSPVLLHPISSLRLAIHSTGYLGTRTVRCVNSLMRHARIRLLGAPGLNGGSLARVGSILTSHKLSLNVHLRG